LLRTTHGTTTTATRIAAAAASILHRANRGQHHVHLQHNPNNNMMVEKFNKDALIMQ